MKILTFLNYLIFRLIYDGAEQMDYLNKRNTNIHIHDTEWEFTTIPEDKNIFKIYGNISCGKFKFIDDNIMGYIEIPKEFIGDGDYFVLRTSGDSMIDCGINDGDLLIIQRQSSADDGQIAAVMVENSVTLKRFYRLTKERKYRLHPENPNYQDIILDSCEILGVAVKIIKDLD